jgi:hypothetical protein
MRRLIFLLSVLSMAFVSLPAFAQERRNLVVNYSFEQGFRPIPQGEVGNGWEPFVISGQPAIVNTASVNPDFTEKIEGMTSQMLWSDGFAFNAGVYQTRGVNQGKFYKAWYATAAKVRSGFVNRTIGLDPTGGTAHPCAAATIAASPAAPRQRRAAIGGPASRLRRPQ